MNDLNELSVLLVDDEPAWLRGLAVALERSANITNIQTCHDSRQVLELLRQTQVDLVLLDITMPHLTGDELLPLILEEHPGLPIIILTGINQIELSVRCMKLGAFDFFVKSIEQNQLIAGITRAFKMLALQQENRKLNNSFQQRQLKQPEVFSEIISADPQILSLCRYLEAVAPGPHPVLISGESGTGKELFARAVHLLSRPRAPWVAINVAGLDDNVFSDSLFGHLRGAFTGADRSRPGMVESAAGGTLFLDEIGDLSLASQVKLLRLLQEGEYLPLGADKPRKADIRVVVATNCNLETSMNEGRFRHDLFYRLAAHRVDLPPLRERRGDIPLLLNHLLAKEAKNFNCQPPNYPKELPVLLGTYRFPGNIRELAAMVSDALGTHQGGTLSMNAFRSVISSNEINVVGENALTTLSFGDQLPTLQEAGELLVTEAMKRSCGNQTIASSMLGISRPALSKRLKKNKP